MPFPTGNGEPAKVVAAAGLQAITPQASIAHVPPIYFV